MNLDEWNQRGRQTNAAICRILEGVIDEGKVAEAFPEDERDAALADAVLAEVVQLNESGEWRRARERFDPAHLPFVPQMEQTELQGITQAVVLGPDTFLVRLGDDTQAVKVMHIDGDRITPLADAIGFAISRNRKHLVLATTDGLQVTTDLGTAPVAHMAWPEDESICPWRMSVSDDGYTVALGNDHAGVWLARHTGRGEGNWVKLAPREGLLEDGEDGEDEDEDGSETIDVLHATVSPDGNFVAIGWQDAPGHLVEKIGSDLSLQRWAIVDPKSDYPYHAVFTDDSKAALFNSRHLQSGSTVYASLKSLKGLEAYDDLPDDAAATDEYLRAYAMLLLPADVELQQHPVAWIGGQGWSHAAPLSGGKPVFTQLFGSSLHAFDYDPKSKRAIVGSASGMLHVLDPFARAELGTAQGYRPRRELYRWIFWDTLKTPIRW